jgi:hypothetical protein
MKKEEISQSQRVKLLQENEKEKGTNLFHPCLFRKKVVKR